MSYIQLDDPGFGFSLNSKLKASGFIQKKVKEIKTTNITSDPIVKLPNAYEICITEPAEKKLSEIIDEINARPEKNFNTDVAKRVAIQIRDLMKKNEELRNSARNNSEKDFELSYFDHIDDALIDVIAEDKEFSSLLLKNEDIKKQLLGIFAQEIYNSLMNT